MQNRDCPQTPLHVPKKPVPAPTNSAHVPKAYVAVHARPAAIRKPPVQLRHLSPEDRARLLGLAEALLAEELRGGPGRGPAEAWSDAASDISSGACEGESATDLAARSDAKLRRWLRQFPRVNGGFFSRSLLIEGVRMVTSRSMRSSVADGASVAGPSLDEVRTQSGLDAAKAKVLAALQMRPTRTRSGVLPVTVLTRPFACPGQCVFCPSDVRMPKSYLSDEPGAQRAEDNGFHPYLQVWNRLAAFRALGHDAFKTELLILGGTWTHYPPAYRRWFVGECLRALHDAGAGLDGRADVAAQWTASTSAPRSLQKERSDFVPVAALGQASTSEVPPAHGAQPDVHPLASYNRLLRMHWGPAAQRAQSFEQMSWEALISLQEANERAAIRCVGLVVETRPDEINEASVEELRRLGVTKVQLGVQSLDDEVLAKNKRGHDARQSREAVTLLRRAGYKIMVHWMPNLLGSTVERDLADFDRLFDAHDGLHPDELKVYPCSLIESAELMEHFRAGAWKPYDEAALLSIIEHVLIETPPWCRLSRVIRDIPSTDIVAGNKRTNLRQVAEQRVLARGGRMRDIRASEWGVGDAPRVDQLRLVTTWYACGGALECFLALRGEDDRLAGFARLSLPVSPWNPTDLQDTANGEGAPGHAGSSGLDVRRRQRHGATSGVTYTATSHGEALCAEAADRVSWTGAPASAVDLRMSAGRSLASGPVREAPADPDLWQELEGRARLRELHVLGRALGLSARASRASAQHMGLGKRLVEAAAAEACQHGFSWLAVIAAVGTRPYYRALGFVDGTLYQHLCLQREDAPLQA